MSLDDSSLSTIPSVPPDSGLQPVQPRSVTAPVARLEDLTPGSMRMVAVGEHKVALITTSKGVFALDNACPHQGYGLVTGTLAGDAVTCQWHNWKFDVATGRCLMGEEDVACHRVEVDQGTVSVTVQEPTAAEQQRRSWPSLGRGLANDYPGQIARDTIRLLDTGATPAQIMAQAVALRVARTEDGVGHEMAMAADCLAWTEVRTGDDRVLPLVQGLAGWAEETRDRPAVPLPRPDASISLPAAIEVEDEAGAMASVRGQLEAGAGPADLRHQFLEAASAHHLSYGHGIIYTHKAFELLERLGWDQARDLLPHLARSLVRSTREDTLPYMRKAMRELAVVDLEALAAAPGQNSTGWHDPGLGAELLEAAEAPIGRAAGAVLEGAGIAGLLDTISEAVSNRLLSHDLQLELDLGEPFGWLDITHGLTTANAVRWAWEQDPGPHTARAALFATWLLFDTGRAERHHRRRGHVSGRPMPGQPGSAGLATGTGRLSDPAGEVGPRPSGRRRATAAAGGPAGPLAVALRERRVDEAVALALEGDRSEVGDALAAAALADRAGSFIVAAHLIKTTEAARREAETLDSSLPLAGVARFLAAPRLERFVARNVAESIEFIRTGRPPRR